MRRLAIIFAVVFAIAARNVLRHRRRSILTLLAIALSVIMMLFAHGLVNGLEKLLIDEAVFGNMGAVQVHKQGFTANVSKDPLSFRFAADAALLAKIAAVKDVTAVSARIPFAAMLSAGDKSLATPILAFDPVGEYAVCPLRLENLTRGARLHAGEAILSPALADRLHLTPGATAVLLGSDSEGVLNAAEAKVAGVMKDVALLTMQPKMMHVALDVAQGLLRMDGQALELAISLKDYRDPDAAKRAIAEVLGAGFEVHTWRERSKAQSDFIEQRKRIFGLITRTFLLLALIGVANTMLMSVLSRTREIGTMLAVGVRRAMIRRLFVAEALVIAVAGTGLGAGIALSLIAWLGRAGLTMPMPGKAPMILHPYASPAFVTETLLFVLVGALLAAALPAHRAAKLKPVEALASL
ncbi:MAG: ABC transporter permease [Deltaproteobacteria bacterium]|nr:ABC transporter permease [Deltaproteobacteria bacterium]